MALLSTVEIPATMILSAVAALGTTIATLFAFLVTIFKRVNQEREQANKDRDEARQALQEALVELGKYKQAYAEIRKDMHLLQANYRELEELHSKCTTESRNRNV